MFLPNMDKCTRATELFHLLCIFLVLQFVPSGGQNVAQDQPEKPFLSKMLSDTVSLLQRSHKNSWEKIKTVVHDLQMQFSPPNLDFRKSGESESRYGDGDNGVKGTMTGAVEKSFDKSKETVQESAKSAGNVVGEATRKTADKVKESVSGKDQHDDAEL